MAEFNFRPKGKSGGYVVHFMFSDETRGERFFDTRFSVGPESTAGRFQVGRMVTASGGFGASWEYTGIDKALKVGERISLVFFWYGLKGNRIAARIQPRVKALSVDEKGWLVVEY